MGQEVFIDQHENENNLFVDLLKYAPSVLLPRLTGLITVPIVTRLFVPEIYGKYALTIAFISLLSAMSSGFGAALIRYLPANEDSAQDRSRFLSTLLITTAISVAFISIISFLALEIFTSGLQRDLVILIKIGLISYVANVAFLMFVNLLRSRRKVGTYSTVQLLQGYGGIGIGILIVIVLGIGVQGLLWGSIAATVIVLSVSYPYLYKEISGLQILYSFKLAKKLFRFSVFVSMGNVVYWILNLSDRWIINVMRGSREVGLYDISYSLAGKTMYILIGAFSLSIQPLVTSIWEREGKERTEDFIGTTTRLYLLFAVPMSVGLSILARPMIRLISTAEYEPGFVVVPYVAVSMLFYGLSDIIGRCFVLNNRPDIETRNYLLAAIINIVLNLIMIPKMGYLAAGITTCAGYLALLVMHAWASKSFIKWKFPKTTLQNVLISSTVMAFSLLAISYIFSNTHILWILLGSVFIGSGIYVSMLILLNEFTGGVRAFVTNVGKQTKISFRK